MDEEFAQTVSRFDLDLFGEIPNNYVVCETLQNQEVTEDDGSNTFHGLDGSQQQLLSAPNPGNNKKCSKGITRLKRMILKADLAVNKLYEKEDEIAKLDETFIVIKNKIRDLCRDKDNIMQTLETLERDMGMLKPRSKKITDQENEASESNVRKLRQQLKERDALIDKFMMIQENRNEYLKTLFSSVGINAQINNAADVVPSKKLPTKREKISLFKFRKLKMEQGKDTEETEAPFFDEQSNDGDAAALSDTDDLNEVADRTQVQTKEINEICDPKVNEFDYEIRSVDTGRGSSLANLNSPDYYADSPASQKFVDAATSPISVICGSNIQTVDRASSPIRVPDIVVSKKALDGIEPLTKNDSDILDNGNTSDCEIEIILNTMKLTDRLITPIPPSPVRSRDSRHEHTYDCPQAENNRKLFENISITISHIQKQMQSIIDKQSKNDDLNTRCNVTVNQKSYYSTEDDNILKNQKSSDDIPEFVSRTSPALQKDLTNTPRDINNVDLQSEIEANVNNEICLVQRIDDARKCFSKHKKKPASKTKKLTRLEKLRNNLKPKCKIRKNIPSPRVLLLRTKLTNKYSEVIKADSAVTLNDSKAYDKAKKVMAEIKSQQKSIIPKKIINKKKRCVENVQKKKESDHPNYHLKYLNRANDKISKEASSPEIINNGTDSDQNNDHPNYQLKYLNSANDKTSKEKTSSPDIINNGTDSNQNNDHANCQLKYLNSANDKTSKEKASSSDILNNGTGSDQHNNISNSVRNNTNDVLEKCISERRRKSFPPEIESNLCKTRKRYPSLCVVLTRSIADLAQPKTNTTTPSPKNCLERGSDNKPATVLNKNILSIPQNLEDIATINKVMQTREKAEHIKIPSLLKTVPSDTPSKSVSYDDLDLFSDVPPAKKQKCHDVSTINYIQNPQKSVLCKFIDDVGVTVFKRGQVKISETVVSSIHAKITESITAILELPPTKTKKAMDQMVKEIKSWKLKEFMAGLMQYLNDITRKFELFNKTHAPPAPSMTKSEQVLLYVLSRLRYNWKKKDLISSVLSQIEYNLFMLNQTPELKIVESLSHLYAVLCRYIHDIDRLRMFMVDAMYCMKYGAVALVKQCISVWMQLLPLAHMGLAKNTMISTLVYLLHFYKCNDYNNMVQDVRNTLKEKYFFLVSDWNESKILETFRNAIMEINDDVCYWERRLLRLAILILAKRQGTTWCQKVLINNMLMPIITKESAPEGSKAFCIFLLGALCKPYPEEMRVHSGIALNKLIDILEKKPSPHMTEAIYCSLICLSRHHQTRVIQELLLWQPKSLTPYMEGVLRDYVKERPLSAWKAILSKIPLTK